MPRFVTKRCLAGARGSLRKAGPERIRPVGLICFSNFSNKFKAAANFQILYIFEFKSENCEVNFNG
jgi:hypothetical protein